MAKKISNADDIMDNYATKCVEDMDMDSLTQYAYDSIYDSLEKDYSDDSLIQTIKDSAYAEILEDVEYD